MRNSCWDCVRKHLAQASILLDETHLGYPHHRWLCAGHLAEAESEVVGVDLEFAKEIRKVRCLIMKSFKDSKEACIEDLIIKACLLADEDDILKEVTEHSSKQFKVLNELAKSVS